MPKNQPDKGLTWAPHNFFNPIKSLLCKILSSLLFFFVPKVNCFFLYHLLSQVVLWQRKSMFGNITGISTFTRILLQTGVFQQVRKHRPCVQRFLQIINDKTLIKMFMNHSM